MKMRLFKLAWIGGLGVYVLFMLYLTWKGDVLHIGGSPYDLLYLYVPLSVLGLIGLGLSLRDGALLHPASLLTVTGVMGSLLAFFLDRIGILRNYGRWVRTMPEISFGMKLVYLAGYSLVFAAALVFTHRLASRKREGTD